VERCFDFLRKETKMNARDLQVTELTKDYVILSGERIDFDEPFDETPNMDEFTQWLVRT